MTCLIRRLSLLILLLVVAAGAIHAGELEIIRTSVNQLAVTSSGRIGAYQPGARLTFFSEGLDYLRDGSLVLGTSRDDLSWAIYKDSGSAPAAANPYGYLLPYSDLTYDTLSSALYRIATGYGVNSDSSVGFSVKYYAPKSSFSYFIARFGIHAGPKDPAATISNLTVAFAADWDIPCAEFPANHHCHDPVRQIYGAQGGFQLPGSKRFGVIAALRDDEIGIPGAAILSAAQYVDPLGTFQVDSLWNRLETIDGYDTTDVLEDITNLVVIARDLTIQGSANDTFFFSIVIAGSPNGSFTGVTGTVTQAYYHVCRNIAPGIAACECGLCGDADGNGITTISDSVYLINYIFNGGPEPPEYCRGDADGNVLINISDAVYLLTYIFGGGPAPPICD